MGYWIYGSYTRFVLRYSLFLLFLPFLLFSLFSPFSPFSIVFSLAIVTSMEVVKTDTSFLAFFLRTLPGIMAFSFTEEAFDIREVFFYFFGNDVNICYRKILVLTLFLSTMAPKTFVVVLIFFIGLVDGRLLFSTKYISKGGVNRLIFFKVFIFFFCWPVTLEIPSINLSYIKRQL